MLLRLDDEISKTATQMGSLRLTQGAENAEIQTDGEKSSRCEEYGCEE